MVTPRRLQLLNIAIDDGTLESALDDIAHQIVATPGNELAPRQFAFVNADCLNQAWTNDRYAALLNTLPRVYGDGSGIRWALRAFQRQTIQDNVNGTDLFPLLCDRAQREGWTLGLVGATVEALETLQSNLNRSYPELKVVVARDGYFKVHSTEETIAAIANARPDVLLVALGSPLQDFWISEHLNQLNAKVAIGVGGLFDFYAESVSRAPMLVRKFGMEWAWRMAQEPGRLWRRYLVGNPIFIARAARNRKRDAAAQPPG